MDKPHLESYFIGTNLGQIYIINSVVDSVCLSVSKFVRKFVRFSKMSVCPSANLSAFGKCLSVRPSAILSAFQNLDVRTNMRAKRAEARRAEH